MPMWNAWAGKDLMDLTTRTTRCATCAWVDMLCVTPHPTRLLCISCWLLKHISTTVFAHVMLEKGKCVGRWALQSGKPHLWQTRAWTRAGRSMGPTNVHWSKGSNAKISGELDITDDPGHNTCHHRLLREIRVSGSNNSPTSPPQLNIWSVSR